MRQRQNRVQYKKERKKFVIIFCEGYTEICYLKTIIKLFNKCCGYQILVIDRPKGKINTEKEELIAIGKSRNKEAKKKLSDKSKSSITNIDMKSLIHSIYFLTDIDDASKNNCFNKDQIDRIRKILFELGIKVLFSNKNIETFVYAHIDYPDRSSCDYKKRIQVKKSKYDKGDNPFLQQVHEDIIGGQSGAGIIKLKDNMEKLKKYHEGDDNKHIYDMDPYSEVVELINDLLPNL